MTDLTRVTHYCPANHHYKIVLDHEQAYPDDPGAGTPAMVYGPRGAAATFYCALETGEMDEKQLPSYISHWLGDMEDHVDEYVTQAFDNKAQSLN